MWILLGILLFLAALITAILLLPVYITLCSDENGNFLFRYKILWKTFGEDPDPNNPITQLLKKGAGIERIEKENFEKNVEQHGFLNAVNKICSLLTNLLKEVIHLLHYCTAKRFEVQLICSAEDAADAAIRYGKCCAIVFPLAGALSANMKVSASGRKIDVQCNFLRSTERFQYHFLLSVRVFRLLAAYLRIAFAEVRRLSADEQTSAGDPQDS